MDIGDRKDWRPKGNEDGEALLPEWEIEVWVCGLKLLSNAWVSVRQAMGERGDGEQSGVRVKGGRNSR